MVLPGTHHGPVHDHHADGRFCGAMNPAACDLDFVPLKSRLNDIDSALVVSISFGGTHCATILRKVA